MVFHENPEFLIDIPSSQLSHSNILNVLGVLGNKCAGQHNLKTVQIREIMWK